MLATKFKTAVGLLLGIGLLASGAGLLTHRALAAKETPAAAEETPKPQPDAAAAKPRPPASKNSAGATSEVAGQVLGPDGKPLAGVKLFLWTNAVKKHADMVELATTGADGRFRLTVAPADRQRDAKIVSKVTDYG